MSEIYIVEFHLVTKRMRMSKFGVGVQLSKDVKNFTKMISTPKEYDDMVKEFKGFLDKEAGSEVVNNKN